MRRNEIPRPAATLHVSQPSVAGAARGGLGRVRSEMQFAQLKRQAVLFRELRDGLSDGLTVGRAAALECAPAREPAARRWLPYILNVCSNPTPRIYSCAI